MAKKIPVGILGATGVVGQRFIQMLENHPWFEVSWLAASDRSAGLPYGKAARWRLSTPLPPSLARMKICPATPQGSPRLIFAALDSAFALELEPQFAAAGCAVVSNSSAFRMYPDIPLVIPEVNPSHLALINAQSWRKKSGGFILTNPNCSAIGLVLALAPLHAEFGIAQVMVVTMQAVSGAGYPGVPSLDILGNVVPYVPGEEDKMEAESRKLLGKVTGRKVSPAGFAISAQCNRVPVEDGHTESVSIKLRKPAAAAAIIQSWRNFAGAVHKLKLPSAPAHPIFYDDAVDRPQPRLDAMRGGGMSATVGKLRPCSVLDWKFTVLSHNSIRGAAGAAVLNAELLKAEGYLS